MARETSITAFREAEKSGSTKKCRKRVYEGICHLGKPTQNEVWKWIGVKAKDVWGPRFAELVRLGVIRCLGKRPCSITGKSCAYYEITGKPFRADEPVPPVEKVYRLKVDGAAPLWYAKRKNGAAAQERAYLDGKSSSLQQFTAGKVVEKPVNEEET